MPSSKEPNLGLNYGWTLGENGWNLQMDENLLALGMLAQLDVLSRSVLDPSGLTPAEGDRYIVPKGAIGVWQGQDGKVVRWRNGSWDAFPPSEGWRTVVRDEGILTSTPVESSVWTSVSAPAVAYRSIAEFGGIFVIGSSGASVQVSSDNGTTWTQVAIPATPIGKILANSAGFSFASANGFQADGTTPKYTTWTSVDGVNWVSHGDVSVLNPQKVLQDKFYSVQIGSFNGTNSIVTSWSADGVTWSQNAVAISAGITALGSNSVIQNFHRVGTTMVALLGNVPDGKSYIYSLDEGLTWNVSMFNVSNTWSFLAGDSTEMIAVGLGSTLQHSVDGLNWTTEVGPSAAVTWYRAEKQATNWRLFGASATDGAIYSSTNLLSWVANTVPANRGIGPDLKFSAFNASYEIAIAETSQYVIRLQLSAQASQSTYSGLFVRYSGTSWDPIPIDAGGLSNGSVFTVKLGEFALDASTTTGLVAGYGPGRVRVKADVVTVSGSTINLAASSTNYLEVSPTGSVSVNQVGFTVGSTPLYRLVTDSAGIVSAFDERTWLPPALGDLDQRYMLSGVDGSDNTLTINGATTLTTASSGKRLNVWSTPANSLIELPLNSQGSAPTGYQLTIGPSQNGVRLGLQAGMITGLYAEDGTIMLAGGSSIDLPAGTGYAWHIYEFANSYRWEAIGQMRGRYAALGTNQYVPLNQADGRYVLSGADSNDNTITPSGSVSLTNAASGKFIDLWNTPANSVISLPGTVNSGWNIRLSGAQNSGVSILSPSLVIYLEDGSTISPGINYALPTGYTSEHIEISTFAGGSALYLRRFGIARSVSYTARTNFGGASKYSSNVNLTTTESAQGLTSGMSYYSNFMGTTDNQARRSADTWSGFDSGNWGTEYFCIGVGTDGAPNDAQALTYEKLRITQQQARFIPKLLGIGGTAPAWGNSFSGANFNVGFIMSQDGAGSMTVGRNVYIAQGGAELYQSNGTAGRIILGSLGEFHFQRAVSGTAGAAVSWNLSAYIDPNGNFGLGSYTPQAALHVQGASQGWNAAAATMVIGYDTTTGRSINAGGTVNASGADYAEYEFNNGLSVAKGDVVGFKSDGTLTKTFAEAIRFGVKSTSPALVGGNDWGSAAVVGETPVFTPPPYKGAHHPGDRPIPARVMTHEAVPVQASNEPDTVFAKRYEAWVETGLLIDTMNIAEQNRFADETNKYEAALALHLSDLDAYQKEVDAAKAAWQPTYDAWALAYEAARSQVDRVAYSGKVPVNVLGASPGDYIVASAASDGSITGLAVTESSITFEQYRKALGRVNRILQDGRAEIAVIVH